MLLIQRDVATYCGLPSVVQIADFWTIVVNDTILFYKIVIFYNDTILCWIYKDLFNDTI